jgi:integrase
VPRKVRDASLETRTARTRLKVRHKPYSRLIEPGLFLCYRKLAGGPGTWAVRRYVGEGDYTLENLRIADAAIVLADDYAEADGERILTFAQAQQRAKGGRGGRATGPYTVGAALDDYLRLLESDGRSRQAVQDARYRIEALIRPRLGTVRVGALTAERLRRWRDETASTAARLRTRNGEQQKYRETSGDDAGRARRATANRTWTVLRAALNHAFHDGKAESDLAWRKVKPFRAVDSARLAYLTILEARRLLNACDSEFRPLVAAALQTGARYGELIRCEVRDFDPDSGTLAIRQSKTGKPRRVILTSEGAALFKQLAAGRGGHELLLLRGNGEPFGKAHQTRPMIEACRRAKISPRISFHGLRHTWASHACMNGVPLLVVARNLGHSDGRMVEKHYGHLAPDYIKQAIREHGPKFGLPKADPKVRSFERPSTRSA